MLLDPSACDVLLVGPRVARLAPFFTTRGYRVTACGTGAEGLNTLKSAPHHIVALELELTDLGARDFLQRARAIAPKTAFMLLDDPSRSGMIVSTLVEGVDVYVPTPPDEERLFEQVARHALASVARGGAPSAEAQLGVELENARAALASTGARIAELGDQKNALERRVADLEAENAALRAAVEHSQATAAGPSSAISTDELDALKASRDFARFLESENDTLKAELRGLRERLLALGETLSREGIPVAEIASLGDLTGEVDVRDVLPSSHSGEFFDIQSDPQIDAFAEGTDASDTRSRPDKKPMSADGPTLHMPQFVAPPALAFESKVDVSVEIDVEAVLRDAGDFEESTDSSSGHRLSRTQASSPAALDTRSSPEAVSSASPRTSADDRTVFDEPTVNAADLEIPVPARKSGTPPPDAVPAFFDDQSDLFSGLDMQAGADVLSPAAFDDPGRTNLFNDAPSTHASAEEPFGWNAQPTMASESPFANGDSGVELSLDLSDDSGDFGEPTLQPGDLKNVDTQTGSGPPASDAGAFDDATLMLDPVEAVEMAHRARDRGGKR